MKSPFFLGMQEFKMFILHAALYLHYTSDRKEIMRRSHVLREIIILEIIYYCVIVM